MANVRACRIAVSFFAVISLLVAVSLCITAATTPQWQVAILDQVNQIRYIGLYQTCAYGSRQGPFSIGQWVCTFIPYGYYGFQMQQQVNLRNQFGVAQQPFVGSYVQQNQVDYTGYGGESWRLATLILMILAAFCGFLSFVFEMIEICLDATRTVKCLKTMSGLSLVTLIFATLFCIIGISTFSYESQQSQNMYIMELTAFSILQWGQSYYFGVVAVAMFIIALVIDCGGTALVCVTARPDREEYRQQLP